MVYLILGLISTWRWNLLLSLRCVDGNWTNFLIGNLNMHLFVRLFISWCLLLEVDSSSFLIYAGVLYLNLNVCWCFILLLAAVFWLLLAVFCAAVFWFLCAVSWFLFAVFWFLFAVFCCFLCCFLLLFVALLFEPCSVLTIFLLGKVVL